MISGMDLDDTGQIRSAAGLGKAEVVTCATVELVGFLMKEFLRSCFVVGFLVVVCFRCHGVM